MPEPHASSAERAAQQVSVLLPLPLSGAYDYRIPPEWNLSPGDFVIAPLGNRKLAGVVWGAASGEVAATKLKHLAQRLGRLGGARVRDGRLGQRRADEDDVRRLGAVPRTEPRGDLRFLRVAKERRSRGIEWELGSGHALQ